ncbi:MAG: glucose 1-dehydrogenase [Acidimicrobiia bacterium]
MLDQFRLDGKVAVITGAGKGIGAETARVLADAGADVALTARTESDLTGVAADVQALGRRALVVPGDVNDLGLLATLVDRTIAEFGRVDIVVNNAGGSASPPFLDTRVEHFNAAFHFNVLTAFELSRLAAPHMLTGPEGGGAIVNISSMASRNPVRGQLVYGTVKAALSHMTTLMAADLAPRIRVNAVLPGAVETEALNRWLDMLDPSTRDEMLKRVKMRRHGVPSDIANAVLYLVSPASSWVTAKLHEVDGGAINEPVPKATPDL